MTLFSDEIYRQVVGIPMGINCATLTADLLVYCFESQNGQILMKILPKFALRIDFKYIKKDISNCLFLDFDVSISQVTLKLKFTTGGTNSRFQIGRAHV